MIEPIDHTAIARACPALQALLHWAVKDPSFTPSMDLTVGYGNYDTGRTSLYATTRLTDTLAINLAVEGEHQAKGWGRDLTNNTEAFDGYSWNRALLSPRSRTWAAGKI
jgi:hypothetical protein